MVPTLSTAASNIRLSCLCCLFIALPNIAHTDEIEPDTTDSLTSPAPELIEKTNLSTDNIDNTAENANATNSTNTPATADHSTDRIAPANIPAVEPTPTADIGDSTSIQADPKLAADATDNEVIDAVEDNSTPDTTTANEAIVIDHQRIQGFFSNTTTDTQLTLYRNAQRALAQNRLSNYQLMQEQLNDHPLYPYLQYSELIKRLKELPYQEVDHFLFKYKDSYLAHRLLTKWLRQLAVKQHWHDYQSYYPLKSSGDLENLKTSTADADLVALSYKPPTDLQCFYLWSRIQTGEEQLLSATRSLWLVGRSQPNSCDRLFRQWQQEGHLTSELMWQRHYLAIQKKNLKLARHLSNKMPPAQKRQAELLQAIHKQPEKITQIENFTSSDFHASNILAYGLYRYAYYQPKQTLQLFKRYRKKFTFSEKEIQRLDDRITLNLIRREHQSLATKRMKKIPASERTTNTERLLRELLEQQDWSTLLIWLDQLPPEQAQSNRWQYWKARALEQTQDGDDEQETITSIYQTLSQKRSFYGFLAADKLQQAYEFENNPANITPQIQSTLVDIPALHRAKALFNLGNMHNARQEWRYGIRGLSKPQLIAAGHLAHQWGWHRKAIEAMSAAKYWDDLNVRFPIVHEQLIKSAAQANAVAAPLVFAIARQESAWEFDARSRVGALGLMQIMPATATETARKAGISHYKEKLLEPKHNIAIGSYYITELLGRFNNNRILAIAAYNAGPHRVQRWLRQVKQPLPYDIWIEIIPFNETRKYVQNVLTYGVLYSHFSGQPTPLLTLNEARASYHKELL